MAAVPRSASFLIDAVQQTLGTSASAIAGVSLNPLARLTHAFPRGSEIGTSYRGTESRASIRRSPTRTISRDRVELKPPDVDLDTLPQQQQDVITEDLRDRVSERMFEAAVADNLKVDQRQAVCNYVGGYARAASLERIIRGNRGFVSTELLSKGKNPEITNFAALKLRKIRGEEDITPSAITTEERISLRKLATVFVTDQFEVESLGIDNTLFTDRDIVQPYQRFMLGTLMDSLQLEVGEPAGTSSTRTGRPSGSRPSGSPSRQSQSRPEYGTGFGGNNPGIFFGTGSGNERQRRGSEQSTVSNLDAKINAVLGMYDASMNRIHDLIQRARDVRDNVESQELVNELRRERVVFRNVFHSVDLLAAQGHVNDQTLNRDYKLVHQWVNHAILKLIDQGEMVTQGAVDLRIEWNGRETYIQRCLPVEFDFYPPLREGTSSVNCARKGTAIATYKFNGKNSFENWAIEFRDNIGRVPDSVMSVAKKLEILRKQCLEGPALTEFQGGMSAVANSYLDYYDGLQRLHKCYGKKHETLMSLNQELSAITFEGKSANEYKKTLTNLQRIHNDMTSLDEAVDVNKSGMTVFKFLEDHVPSTIWSEVAASIQIDLPKHRSRLEYGRLFEYAIS